MQQLYPLKSSGACGICSVFREAAGSLPSWFLFKKVAFRRGILMLEVGGARPTCKCVSRICQTFVGFSVRVSWNEVPFPGLPTWPDAKAVLVALLPDGSIPATHAGAQRYLPAISLRDPSGRPICTLTDGCDRSPPSFWTPCLSLAFLAIITPLPGTVLVMRTLVKTTPRLQ